MIEVDARRYEVRVDGRTVDVTCRPFQVLQVLAEDPGRCYRKRELEMRVWGAPMPYGRALDVTVARLRRVIGRDAIKTVHGVGFALVANAEAAT